MRPNPREGPISVDFGVFIFHGQHTAKQVLEEVRGRGLAWLQDVAVVERDGHGRMSVHSSWAQNERDRKGLGWGAATGALIGVLAGPAGIVAGAVIGATSGGLGGAMMDITDNDPRLQDVGKSLDSNTSALMLWANPTDVDAFVAVFKEHGAKLIRSSLSEKQSRKLKVALRSAEE